MGKNFGNKNNAAKQSGGFRGPKQQTNFKAKFKPPGKNQSGGGGGGFNKGKRSGDFNSSDGGQGGFNKNKAMNRSGNFGQQKNFKPNFKSPGKFQSGGQGFNKNKPAGNFKSPSLGGNFNKNSPAGGGFNKNKTGGQNPNFKSSGKKPMGDSFNKNMKGAKAQKEKLKFGEDSSDEEDEEIDDEELGDLSEEDMMGSDDADEMESEEEEESDDAMTSPAKSKQNAATLKNKLAEVKPTNVKVEQKKSPVKTKIEAKTPPTAKVEAKDKSAKNTKGTEAPKEKLKFDEDSSDEEDEEMMGSDDEDEMESEEEEESDDSVTSPAKVSKQMETTKRKLAEMKPTNVKVETKTSPVKTKVEAKTPPTAKVEEQVKDKSAKDTKVMPKEKLHFDEDSSDEEDEEVGDEEMEFSDEEMMGSDDEDEMESEEEEESDDAMTSPAKSKQNTETLKRKLAEIKTPPTPQSAVKKARLEGGEERSVKVEEGVKEKPAKKADKKEAKKEKKVEQQEVQNIPKLSDEQVKAIIAEEDRRREERDKRTLFTRCETFKLMKESDIKALHPDIVSIRHNHGQMSWLIFPSEASAVKAYNVLAQKTELDGKEFFVDRSGANSKNQPNAKGKFDSKGQRPINPLELVLVHLPKPTTEEQLRVVFPTATQIEIPAKEKKPGKKPFSFGGRSIAFIKFGNVADAKKAFESHGNQAMLKIGGELIDMYYRRH